MQLHRVVLGVFAVYLGACGSSGAGGGAVSCFDGGSCPTGYVCSPNGACVQQATGSSGNSGGGGAGGSAASGGSSGFGGTVATGGSGGSGGSAASGGSGGSAASGGSGGSAASGGSGGSGGSVANGCLDALYGKTCSQISSGSSTCDTCAKTYCCGTIDPCLANQNCAQGLYCALNYCASAVDPLTCIMSTCQSCASSQALIDVSTCLQTSCAAECPF